MVRLSPPGVGWVGDFSIGQVWVALHCGGNIGLGTSSNQFFPIQDHSFHYLSIELPDAGTRIKKSKAIIGLGSTIPLVIEKWLSGLLLCGKGGA